MKMDRGDPRLVCSVLLYVITQVCCQLCAWPCECPPGVLRCPAGVSQMLDSCGCCQMCARQEGEACSERLPCDAQRGLKCDYSSSFPGGPGLCVDQNELGCEMNGRRLEEGQVFQPSCGQLCHCLGGGVTCVPLCTEDVQRPTDQCPNPQLVQLPGRCCKEWVCKDGDNSISSNPSSAEQARPDFGGGLSPPSFDSTSNCIQWSSEWGPCSHSCGPGVSTRTTNRNWACRLQTEGRLCQVRPCHGLLPGLRRLHTVSGGCESSYTSLLPLHLEHQGCWSARAYRQRFCAAACSPSLTRTVRVVFRCPKGRLTQQPVMVIQSCSCSTPPCRPPASAARSPLPWL